MAMRPCAGNRSLRRSKDGGCNFAAFCRAGSWPARGLSLVECLVTLALVAVLSNIAWPAWQGFLRSQAIKAAGAQWMACLVRARSEALQTGTDVAVLPLPGGFAQGWALTRDANGNGVLDAGEERLQVYGPLPAAMKTEINFGKQGLRFQASGRPSQAGNVTLELQGVRRKLILNMLGRARLCDPDRERNC